MLNQHPGHSTATVQVASPLRAGALLHTFNPKPCDHQNQRYGRYDKRDKSHWGAAFAFRDGKAMEGG